MKVLQLSTTDIEGGAARSAYRVHQGLTNLGVDSQMLVRAKFSKDKGTITQSHWLTKIGPTLSNWPLRNYPQREGTLFSSQWFFDAVGTSITHMKPDIVNLHWICNGYLRIETLQSVKCPLVWTLQDMWPITGGCHYCQDCDRYQSSCGNCPQLQSSREKDLSRQIWQRKHKSWKHLDITIVAPSHWMADCARASSLFRNARIEVIPFCLDTEAFRPHDKAVARQVMRLPQDKKIIVFGALAATSDKRKGFDLLVEALKKLSQAGLSPDIELAVFGSSTPDNPVDLGFKVHYLGHLNDDLSLSLAYAVGDVMVVPSLQESFGQTASESLACGTPVVAFNATGLKDIVDHRETGYLAVPYSADDLARGIAWILEDSDRHQKLVYHARNQAVQKFSLELQARRYFALYEDLQKISIAQAPHLPLVEGM